MHSSRGPGNGCCRRGPRGSPVVFVLVMACGLAALCLVATSATSFAATATTTTTTSTTTTFASLASWTSLASLATLLLSTRISISAILEPVHVLSESRVHLSEEGHRREVSLVWVRCPSQGLQERIAHPEMQLLVANLVFESSAMELARREVAVQLPCGRQEAGYPRRPVPTT